jgi:hypothetical protein
LGEKIEMAISTEQIPITEGKYMEFGKETELEEKIVLK